MIGPSDIQIILGKVRPLSRRLAEAHPQVLIIAPADMSTPPSGFARTRVFFAKCGCAEEARIRDYYEPPATI